MLEVGVDTWRVLWAVHEPDEMAYRGICTRCTSHGFKATQSIDGYTVGWEPHYRLAWAEGHPAGKDGLAASSDLGMAFVTLQDALAAYGLRVGDDAAVSRLDIAATVGFQDPCEGEAVLAGISLMRLPRCKPEVHGYPVETVYFKAIRGQRKYCRIYDYGVSRQWDERGRWLRFEDQRRYPSGRRPRAAALTAEMVRAQFQHRFAPLLRASQGVMVGGPSMIARELVARVRADALSVREAERIAGFLLLEAAGGGVHTKRTLYRRHRELAEHGFVVAREDSKPIEFDLAAIFATTPESELWRTDD